MAAKLSVLRACRSLLRPGATLAFTTIHLPPGATERDRRRAAEAGPRAIANRADHQRLLATARFTNVRHEDLTDGFRRTAQAWLDESARYASDLVAEVGRADFEERQKSRRQLITAVDAGLIRRSLYVARRPDRT